ncbi:MAG TPA: vWA domain-containing protein, partial [Bacteroidia bacterium]|nr:vWA domain-containing protein [Bacteroidia bacterium]
MPHEVERFIFLNPIGVLGWILVSLISILVFYSALKGTKRIKSSKRVVLISLRLLSFFLIIFILSNPALRIEDYKEEKSHLAILVDHSWSMTLPENETGTSRIQAIRNFFKNHADFFSEIKRNFLVSYYVFDESLKPASVDSINTDEPDGKGTDIGEAIKEIEKSYGPGGLDSIILFSDGADNGTIRRNTDEFLKNIGFRINTVASLDDKVRDIWIDSVKSSEVAFLRYPISVDVVVKSVGFKAPHIPVILKEGDKIISTQEISIDSGEGKKVEFILKPTSIGRKIYTVSIPVVAGEIIKENNQKSFAIDVVINKIRVLHIAGGPSWDVRFLRKALKRNPNVDLVAFFIL